MSTFQVKGGNKVCLRIGILTLLMALSCQSQFIDFGVGYARFNTDDMTSRVTINSKPVDVTLNHVDAFMLKMRGGGSFIEALPQLRAGIELRGGIGGARDTEKVDEQTAYSEITMLSFGGGPVVSWKQPLGKQCYVEAGSFFGGYTVGVHEKGRKRYGIDWEEKEESGTGWSGGVYGKLGLLEMTDISTAFALEGAYEVGKWNFGGDIGHVSVTSLAFLFSVEVGF
jgi:hypothetical protein